MILGRARAALTRLLLFWAIGSWICWGARQVDDADDLSKNGQLNDEGQRINHGGESLGSSTAKSFASSTYAVEQVFSEVSVLETELAPLRKAWAGVIAAQQPSGQKPEAALANAGFTSAERAALEALYTLGSHEGRKMLIMPPVLFDSHLMIHTEVAANLYRKYGHETVLLLGEHRSPIRVQSVTEADKASETGSSGVRVKRYPSTLSTEEASAFLEQRVQKILNGSPMILQLLGILKEYARNCDVFFTNGRTVLEELRREKFDVVLVDPNELCGFLLAKELGVPHVALSTGMWTPSEAALPQPVSYVPEFNSLMSDRMSLVERLMNLGTHVISRVGTQAIIFPMYNMLIKKHHIVGPTGSVLGRTYTDVAEIFSRRGLLSVAVRDYVADDLDAEDKGDGHGLIHNAANFRKPNVEWISSMVSRTKLWLVASDFALDFPRPLAPHVEFVGGLLGRHPSPLPTELDVWANNASDGFIVVSFGAGVKRLTPRLEAVFVEALSKVNLPVIWRMPLKGREVPENVGSNVKLVDWLPQNDLLGHPKCLLFVGHGGTNGVYEALYHGVPVVAMPLFGDHYDSATRVQAKGFGKLLAWKNVTSESLLQAIFAVLYNPSYRARAKFISRVHRDQPASAIDRAAARLDYTLRYKGADHLRPAIVDLSFMQVWYLDALLVTVAAVLLLNLALRTSRKFTSRYVSKGPIAAALTRTKCGDNNTAQELALFSGNNWASFDKGGFYASPTTAEAAVRGGTLELTSSPPMRFDISRAVLLLVLTVRSRVSSFSRRRVYGKAPAGEVDEEVDFASR